MVLSLFSKARGEAGVDELLRRKQYAKAVELLKGELLKRKHDRSLRIKLADVLALSAALALAHFGAGSPQLRAAERLRARMAQLVTPETPLTHKELAVSGKDLMAALALPPGPKLGELLDALLEAVLDDPAQNRAEQLLRLARERIERALR